MTEISPAILTNDISDFRHKYSQLLALSHYFTKLHVDFIDDTFIHNKTVLPADLGFLKTSPFQLIAHFMTAQPAKYFAEAKAAGFKSVIVQLEAFSNDAEMDQTLEAAKKLDLKPGISISAETPLPAAGKYLQKVDLIQLMGIHPGFQGRPFMMSTIGKIQELRALSKSVIILVDGGIKVGIARQCAQAGADILVAGSAIAVSEDAQLAIEALKADIET